MSEERRPPPVPDGIRLAVHHRNARLRAFQGLGVPVAGRWHVDPDPDWNAIFFHLEVECTTCGIWAGESGDFKVSVEHRLVQEVLDQGCPHLALLRAKNRELPEEFQALWKLELLAG